MRKTLPPDDSKEEELIKERPSFSKWTKSSDNGVVRTPKLEIWITTSDSLTWVADTADKDPRVIPFFCCICFFPDWLSCLASLESSSSFLWTSLSTWPCSSGMYFSTPDTVAAMLSFFCWHHQNKFYTYINNPAEKIYVQYIPFDRPPEAEIGGKNRGNSSSCDDDVHLHYG